MEIKFNYSAIRTDQFATFDSPNGFSPQDCSFTGEVQTANNYEARTIMIKVLANIKYGENLILTLGVSSYFKIEENSWQGLINDEFVIMPKEFLWHIGGLAVSTTRGILFAKTESTDLNRIIFPIIYIDQIITSDMKIPIPESYR